MSRQRGEAATRREISPLGFTEILGNGPKPMTRRRVRKRLTLRPGTYRLTAKLSELRGESLKDTSRRQATLGSAIMTLGTILVIILILILIGAIPNWGYSRGWGYGPSGIVGVILLIVIILLLMGRI